MGTNGYDHQLILNLINQSDVAILSSKNEGFGLAIVEGMASCKPVIASDISGIKEIVEDYDLLFEKGNEIELAKLITRLIEDVEFYEKTANKCNVRANEFDITKMIDMYTLQYEKVLL